MAESDGPRSVKIGADERTGWSSERPRRAGGPERPPDISVRCKGMRPAEEIRYSPGSLVLIASASEEDREALAERVIEQKGAVLARGKVRGMLAGRVPDEEMEARAAQLIEAAAAKRLAANESTVIVTSGLDPAERERFARLAAGARRPRHLVLVETARERVGEDDLAPLNELRRRLDAGELGAEGEVRRRGGTVAVIEARDRVGGKMFTADVGGCAADLGAHWVGPAQRRLLALAHELGIDVEKQYLEGKHLLAVGGERHSYKGNIPLLSIRGMLDMGRAVAWAELRRLLVDREAPWRSRGARRLD